MLLKLRLGALAFGLFAISATGCTARTTGGVEVVYGHPAVEVEVVPAHIHSHPRVAYHGSYAYLVEGRWYYRSPRGRWVVFREEPVELRRYRVQYYERYPAARRRGPVQRQPEYGSPPPYRRDPYRR
jgi:hypothetical protein